MGPRASTIADPKQQAVLENYDIIQEIPNQNIRFLQHKTTKKQYLLRQLSFNDKKQYQKTANVVKTKIQQLKNNQHVVPIVQFFKKQQDQYCSTFYKIYVLFQFPQRTLDDQINQRNLKKNMFAQYELWSILASCILGMSHLQKKGIKHGSLKSSSILLSQEGVIKVYDPFALMQSTNYDTLLNKRQTRHVYLSPQQCEALQNQTISPVLNVYKSDIFTLGMIILQCGLLSYQDECYRDQYSRLHWQTLQYNKNRFSKIYTQQLTNMISYMLQKNERLRPQWIQLQEHVMKVQDNVRDSFISSSAKNGYRQSKAITATKPLSSFIRPFGQSNNNANQPFRSSSVVPGMRNSDFFNSKPVSVKIHRQFQNKNQPANVFRNVEPYNNYHQFVNQNNQVLPKILSKGAPSQMQRNSFNRNQINLSQKNDSIVPIKISDINLTRPLRSFFPNPNYVVQTKIDQNLIVVQDQGNNSQIFSESEKSKGPTNPPFNQIDNYSNNFSPYSNNNHQARNIKQQPVNHSRSNFNANRQQQQNFMGQFVVETFKLGSRYEGYKLNGMRNGPGKFFYQDGGMYDGNWVNNKMEGFGRLFYQSGKIAYQGEWIQDQFTGNGTLFNQNPDQLNQAFNYSNFDDVEQYWTKYEGIFLQDMKHGHGLLFLSNGETFQGNFNNDVVQGQGVYNSLSGKIKGIWQNNSLVRKL